MIRTFLLFTFFIVFACFGACSSGDDGDPNRLLRFGPQEITESETRELLREYMAENESYEIQCAALDQLSDEEAAAALIEYNLRTSQDWGSNDDQRRLVEIYREECEAAGLS